MFHTLLSILPCRSASEKLRRHAHALGFVICPLATQGSEHAPQPSSVTHLKYFNRTKMFWNVLDPSFLKKVSKSSKTKFSVHEKPHHHPTL